MMKFDHLRIPVTDSPRSRDWYVTTLGLKVEFEVPDRRTIALQDSEDFAIFLQEASSPISPNECALWFQVTDVDATFAEWSARASSSRTARANPIGVTGSSSPTPMDTLCASGTNIR
jgi:catechol 2,3-dioxygenase-like lactoylglutathione lyase family enzyme